MTFLSSIRFSARIVQSSPVHFMPSQGPTKHCSHSPSANPTSPVIHLHDTLAVSKAPFEHTPRKHYNMPCPDIHKTWPLHVGAHALIDHIMHYSSGHRKIFARGGGASNTQQIYTTLKAAGFPATSTLQHPTGHRQSHAAEVLDKKAALDFGPGSI